MSFIDFTQGLADLTVEDTSAQTASKRQVSLKKVIKQHLEQLLNARRPYFQPNLDLPLMQYGLPDLSQFNPHSDEDCAILSQSIQKTIALFEPRLKDVEAEILENEDDEPGVISLRLSGQLNQGQEEPVEFISWLNPNTYEMFLEEVA